MIPCGRSALLDENPLLVDNPNDNDQRARPTASLRRGRLGFVPVGVDSRTGGVVEGATDPAGWPDAAPEPWLPSSSVMTTPPCTHSVARPDRVNAQASSA